MLYTFLSSVGGQGSGSEEEEEEEEGKSPDDDSNDDTSSVAWDVVAGCHRLPDASTLEQERRLQRIATTGGG